MLGHEYRCSGCGFSFSSGWSHHAGGQFLVCRACAACFVLGGGRSCWGARAGERLELVGDQEGEPVPTGVTVVVTPARSGRSEESEGVFYLAFDEVPCPACGGMGALTQWLEPGEGCPKCRSGRIAREGTCIY